jgi:DNA-binding transcriptional LysR family regulator
MGMLLDIVAGGLAVAILPGSARRATPVRFVSLGRAAPRWKVGVVVPAERPLSAAAQRVLEMLLAEVA